MLDRFQNPSGLGFCRFVAFVRIRFGYKQNGTIQPSPYETCYGALPNDLKHVRILGSPCWPVTDAFSDKFDVNDCEQIYLGPSNDEHIKGSFVYSRATNKVTIAGMMSYYENVDNGRLHMEREFNPYDMQDSNEYKELLLSPPFSEEKCIKSLVEIVEHQTWWAEEDEGGRAYACVKIRTKSSPEPF